MQRMPVWHPLAKHLSHNFTLDSLLTKPLKATLWERDPTAWEKRARHKREGKSYLAGSSPVGEVALVSQLSSPGIKREITSATSFHQDCINELRWEASGHREPRSVEGCKRKAGSAYELHRLNEGFIATALLFLSQFPCSPSTLFFSPLGHPEMEAKHSSQRSRSPYCCCQQWGRKKNAVM